MALIKTTAQLREFVKINASKDFTTYSPFIDDAQEKYLEPYFGSALLETLEESESDVLRKKLSRALGPFSLALATDEFSIQFGETGHTVARTDSLAPASDAKIEKATESLFSRAWANLDTAIRYVIEHKTDYPDWSETDFAKKLSTNLFANATDFQENGLVDIDYSPLTFHRLRMLILRIEKTEALPMLPVVVGKTPSDTMKAALQAYTASRAAALHTSQTTREQRSQPRTDMEFKPIVRPLYDDPGNSGNYFAVQADFWRDQIMDLLVTDGWTEKDERALEWNNEEKRIFVFGAKREELLP